MKTTKEGKNVEARQFRNTQYYVMPDGCVLSRHGDEYRPLSQILTPTGRYKFVKMYFDGARRNMSVHTLVALCFLGDRPKGAQVNHKDGNRLNNHISNLEYCTPGENIRHAVALGLKRGDKGEANSMAKLNSKSVLRMRELYACGYRIRDLAKLYPSISRSNIGMIVNNETWTHLPTVSRIKSRAYMEQAYSKTIG